MPCLNIGICFYFKRSNDVATTYMWGGLLGFLSEAAGRVVSI